MMGMEKIRRKLKEESERVRETDDSDIPVHERYVKDEKLKQAKNKEKSL